MALLTHAALQQKENQQKKKPVIILNVLYLHIIKYVFYGIDCFVII